MNDLITTLSEKHAKKAWWKETSTMLTLWFVFHLIYFVGLGLSMGSDIQLRSSALYLFFITLGVVASGAIFITITQHLNLKRSFFKMWLGAIVLWMGGGFLIENFFQNTILHQRNLSLTQTDLTCFWHGTLTTLGPVLIFPFIFKHFFTTQKKWALTFMSLHLAFMGSLLIELQCPDREMWHLILGHQSSFLGVGACLIVITLYAQKLVSLKTKLLDGSKL